MRAEVEKFNFKFIKSLISSLCILMAASSNASADLECETIVGVSQSESISDIDTLIIPYGSPAENQLLDALEDSGFRIPKVHYINSTNAKVSLIEMTSAIVFGSIEDVMGIRRYFSDEEWALFNFYDVYMIARLESVSLTKGGEHLTYGDTVYPIESEGKPVLLSIGSIYFDPHIIYIPESYSDLPRHTDYRTDGLLCSLREADINFERLVFRGSSDDKIDIQRGDAFLHLTSSFRGDYEIILKIIEYRSYLLEVGYEVRRRTKF